MGTKWIRDRCRRTSCCLLLLEDWVQDQERWERRPEKLPGPDHEACNVPHISKRQWSRPRIVCYQSWGATQRELPTGACPLFARHCFEHFIYVVSYNVCVVCCSVPWFLQLTLRYFIWNKTIFKFIHGSFHHWIVYRVIDILCVRKKSIYWDLYIFNSTPFYTFFYELRASIESARKYELFYIIEPLWSQSRESDSLGLYLSYTSSYILSILKPQFFLGLNPASVIC